MIPAHYGRTTNSYLLIDCWFCTHAPAYIFPDHYSDVNRISRTISQSKWRSAYTPTCCVKWRYYDFRRLFSPRRLFTNVEYEHWEWETISTGRWNIFSCWQYWSSMLSMPPIGATFQLLLLLRNRLRSCFGSFWLWYWGIPWSGWSVKDDQSIGSISEVISEKSFFSWIPLW